MYTVPEYLRMLKRARLAPGTLDLYARVFRYYGEFLGVPVDEIHNHLSAENLIKYADSRSHQSGRTVTMHLSILHKYFEENGVRFSPLELKVIKAGAVRDERQDKPLTLPLLQQMMDLADIHGKALLSTLVSTGMRRTECAGILLSDMDGDTITIRNAIAKRGRGGKVYLTSEAQEFIALWLKDRPAYIDRANSRAFSGSRPADDQRLFACSGRTIRDVFINLYRKADGERGKYGYRCTPHSCRRYFRTVAVQGMGMDLVEHLLRHSGYLTDSYRRITDEDARKRFHESEAALYITRRDHRLAQSSIERLEARNRELEGKVREIDILDAKVKILEDLVSTGNKI